MARLKARQQRRCQGTHHAGAEDAQPVPQDRRSILRPLAALFLREKRGGYVKL